MSVKSEHKNGECSNTHEQFEVQLTNPMLYDKLRTLSTEYSVSMELLVNMAVKRLVEDVEFVRRLRTGEAEGA